MYFVQIKYKNSIRIYNMKQSYYNVNIKHFIFIDDFAKEYYNKFKERFVCLAMNIYSLFLSGMHPILR